MSTKAPHNIEIPASTARLGEIRHAVADVALSSGFTNLQVQDIQLAVDEACSNVIKHAYKGDSTKKLRINIRANSVQLEIVISDQGQAFDESSYREPDIKDRIKHRMKGGVGVYLMRKLMDKVEYHSEHGENYIRLVKKR